MESLLEDYHIITTTILPKFWKPNNTERIELHLSDLRSEGVTTKMTEVKLVWQILSHSSPEKCSNPTVSVTSKEPRSKVSKFCRLHFDEDGFPNELASALISVVFPLP